MSQGGAIGGMGQPAGNASATPTVGAPAATPAAAPAATPAAVSPVGAVGDQSIPPWARPYADQQAMLQQAQPAMQSYADQSGVSNSWNRQQDMNSLQTNMGGMGRAAGGKGGMPGQQGGPSQGLSDLMKQFAQQQQGASGGLGSTPQAQQSSTNSLQ